MAEDQPSLHIDTDWKKQAQEEKRRLAEQEAQRRAAQQAQQPAAAPPGGPAGPAAVAPGMPPGVGAGPAPSGAAAPGAARGEAPAPTFATLVQSVLTQILFYLGELAPRGQQPMVNLDMAKHNIDMLGLLEQKTKGNLTEDEQRLLDNALYETRMRYVSVASQYATV